MGGAQFFSIALGYDHARKFGRGPVADAAVWTLFVVLRLPKRGAPTCVEKVGEPTRPQLLFAQPPVKALHLRVLPWLARMDMAQLDLPLQRPYREMRTRELLAIVATNRPRRATISSSTRITCQLAKPVSTSGAKHSRVKASTTLSTRMFPTAAMTSCAKLSTHSWFAQLGRTAATTPARSACAFTS